MITAENVELRPNTPRILVAAFILIWHVIDCPAARAEAPKNEAIIAIVAADTLEGPSGAGVSEMKVDYALQWMQAHGIPAEIVRLKAEEICPSAIVAAIRRTEAAMLKTRTLFVYYAGHGATDSKGGGHFLRTPRGDLPRATLVGEIVAKAPALAIVVTGSCSVEGRMNGWAP